MYTTTTGYQNVGIGYNSLRVQTTGYMNTAVGGNLTLGSLTEGYKNTAVGMLAGEDITDGVGNTCFGNEAGKNIASAHNNTMIGNGAGTTNATGNNNVIIGTSMNVGASDTSHAIGIGHNFAVSANDFSFGKASNVVTNDFDADAAFSRSSDERLKKNITAVSLGLDFIDDLRPVKFKWKAISELATNDSELAHIIEKDEDGNYISEMNTDVTMHGFIAQEVKAALDTAGVSDFAGWSLDAHNVQQISREMFVVPLVKAVQELSAKNDTLETANTALADRITALENA